MATYGRAAVLRAGKRIAWTANGPISLGEDLFGCGDLLLLRAGRPLLVQVTTQTLRRSSVSPRRQKVQAWLAELGEYRCDAWVIAWVPRTHFRRWVWRPVESSWAETDPFWSAKLTALWEEASREKADPCDDPDCDSDPPSAA
jgi:hypothetical protein